jgi:hypothetical protein
MSIRALDHSTNPPDPLGFARAALDAGYGAVLRYLPLPPGTLTDDVVGRLTRAEVDAYHAAGLGVGIIWETTQYRALMGLAAGVSDGIAARSAANALGFPPYHPIFGAVDFNPIPPNYPAIADYLRGGNFAPYANGPLLSFLNPAHSWMHNWGGSGYPLPHIHQQGGQVTIGGVNCDQNDVYQEDCIWFPPNPQPAVEPKGGPNVYVDAKIQQANIVNGRGWIDVPVPDGMAVISLSLNGADALDGQPLPHIEHRERPGPIAGHWRVNFDGAPGPMDVRVGLS